MKKEKEILTLLIKEIQKYDGRSKIQLETTIFLGNEIDKLKSKMNDPNTTFEEGEKTCKELASLQIRIQKELSMLEDDIIKVIELDDRMNELLLKNKIKL